MRRLFVAVLLLISTVIHAQPPGLQNVANGTFNVAVGVPGGSSDFQLTGFFNDLTSRYADVDVVPGMIFWDVDGQRFEVMAVSGLGVLTLDVRDIDGVGTVSTGIGALIVETSDYPFHVAGVSDELNSIIFNHLVQLLANQQTVDPVTITQAGHGFALGDLLTFNGGTYAAANTATASNLPVAYVSEVIDVNTFRISTEGWLEITSHGFMVGQDYYLQDGGAETTSPDTNYVVFAYRAFDADWLYYDIPEAVFTNLAASSVELEQLTVTAQNVVSNLSNAPGDPTKILFYVNGVNVFPGAGLSSDAAGVITVNSGLLGYNIETTDSVVAYYFY